MALKQTAKINIMPSEINSILSFWVNNVSSFYKTEAPQENIHGSNFCNINDAVWVCVCVCVCACMKTLYFYLIGIKYSSAWSPEATEEDVGLSELDYTEERVKKSYHFA